MRFNLEQLRAFSLSAELGSFSAAARRMGKAQSAVSTAIAHLELDLGLELFDRRRREPSLTETGQALLPQARALLEQARMLADRADGMAAGEEGRLALAVEEALLGNDMEALLVRFAAAFPQLELELLTPARTDIVTLIQQGRADIGVLLTPLVSNEGIQLRPLRQMAMIAVVAPQHPLAGQRLEHFDALRPHRQLLLTSRGGPMLLIEQFSSQIWKVESQHELIALARRGLGWAWVPEHLARPALEDGSLRMLHFDSGGDLVHMPVDLITSPRYREGKAGRWLYGELAELSFLI